MKLKLMHAVSTSMICFLAVACSKSAAVSDQPLVAASPISKLQQGNDRGNGGNALPRKSSLSLVQSTLREFQERAIGYRTVGGDFVETESCELYQFGDDWKFAGTVAHRATIKDASENACRLLRNLVRNNRILIQETDCKDSGSGAARDGSVSQRSPSGTICISTQRLQRLSPAELKPQVAGLFLHEIMHLLGYGEDIAVYIQEYYLRDGSNGLDWSPYSDTIGKTRAILASIAKPEELKGNLESSVARSARFREFLENLQISCTDDSGAARDLNSLRALIYRPETLAKLGLVTDGFMGDPRDRDAFLSFLSRIRAGGQGISKRIPQIMDLTSNAEWRDKTEAITAIVKSTSDQYESIYPYEKQLSVCEETAIRAQATLLLRLEEQRSREIFEILKFD